MFCDLTWIRYALAVYLKIRRQSFNILFLVYNFISSIGNGGFSAVLKKLRLNRTIPYTTFHQMVNHVVVCQSFDGKLYVFPIESAFEYSHQPNSKNNYSVTFSENRKSMMSFHRDFPKEMSHEIVYQVIFTKFISTVHL